jgi:D-alanyl-D-alanine endopeptidase (penicillin-binding protein 7)
MRFLIILLLLVTTNTWARNEPSILLYDIAQSQMVQSQHIDQVRPIASITKVMTAIVALELKHDPQGRIEVDRKVNGVLAKRQYYTRHELLMAMLIRSDNSAAETLANDHPLGRRGFLEAMNAKARELGMTNSHFDDASGLSSKNTSTAQDLMIMFKHAMTIDKIRLISTVHRTEIEVQGKKNRPARIVIQNTNTGILDQFNSVILSKTGLTTPAGYCMGLVLDEARSTYVLIVLGGRSKQHRHQLVSDTINRHIRESF